MAWCSPYPVGLRPRSRTRCRRLQGCGHSYSTVIDRGHEVHRGPVEVALHSHDSLPALALIVRRGLVGKPVDDVILESAQDCTVLCGDSVYPSSEILHGRHANLCRRKVRYGWVQPDIGGVLYVHA
jgi:hypothetical protein